VLSHVDFTKVGLPALDKESAPAQVRRVSDFIYQGFLTPLVVYGGVAALMRTRWKDHLTHAEHEPTEAEGKKV
jgi:hypothetical protein